MTDGDGRFAFANLPVARYTVTAAKASYVTTEYGATRPGGRGTAVEIGTKPSITDLTVRLARGAVITGRLTRTNGQPAAWVPVLAVPATALRAGTASADGETRSLTDDRGVYRIFGLLPGAYAVVAMMGSGEREVRSTADVDAVFARLQQQMAGVQPLPSVPAAGAASTPPGAIHLAAPMFYPGTPSADDAQAVTVAIGEERNGVDMIVGHVRAHTIDGVIVSADGSSIDSVGLGMVSGGLRMLTGIGGGPRLTIRPGADGRFQLASVTPGRHTLIAWTTTTGAKPEPGRGRASIAPMVTALYASADLSVTHDVTGVVLTLRPAARFTGRVVVDGGSAPPPDLTTVRLTLSPATEVNRPIPLNGVSTAPLGRTPSALLGPDGRFDIANVMPNIYVVTVTSPGPTSGSGWWLRSAMADGRDLLDTLYDAGADADRVTAAVLTLSDRHTELTGRLQTPAGRPATDYFIVAVTTDRALWRPNARRVQSTRPGTDGTYSFKNLPPGEYFLAALTDLDPDQWETTEFLSQIAGAAIRVAIGEGERKVQDLRLRSGTGFTPRLRRAP